MTTVAQILKNKSRTVWSISPGKTVYRALELMAEKDIGAVLVMDGEKLAGMLSERDYARRVILKGKSSRDMLVKDLMTKVIVTVTPEQTIENCMQLMTDKHLRHLPVLDNGKLAGIITIGDVVKAIMEEQKSAIQSLENYISGKA